MFLLSKKSSSIFKAINSISIVLITLIFAFICLDIYSSGVKSNSLNIFTLDAISYRLSLAAPYLIVLVLIVVISSFILNLKLDKSLLTNKLSSKNKLTLIKKDLDIIPESALKEERKRVKHFVTEVEIQQTIQIKDSAFIQVETS